MVVLRRETIVMALALLDRRRYRRRSWTPIVVVGAYIPSLHSGYFTV